MRYAVCDIPGEGALPVDATVTVPGAVAETPDGQTLYSQDVARAALHAAIDEGFLRLEMIHGELVAIWTAHDGHPEARVYPGRDMPDVH